MGLPTKTKSYEREIRMTDRKKNKVSIYLPKEILDELKNEKERLDRSASWLIQRAWKVAYKEIKKMPSIKDSDT